MTQNALFVLFPLVGCVPSLSSELLDPLADLLFLSYIYQTRKEYHNIKLIILLLREPNIA